MHSPSEPHAARAATPQSGGWIAQRPALRVIVDNDFAGDPDGLFALAHQWLSPGARTVLVTTSALNARLAALAGMPAGRTAEIGRELALQLAAAAGIADPCPVLTGAEAFGTGPASVSAAAHAIVAEAERDDALPLVVACGGPLTNVAAALRLSPRIASRLSVVWIGGSLQAGSEPEYNLATDLDAARQALLQPGLHMRVVPRETYRQLAVSVAELGSDLRPLQPLGHWLYGRYLSLPPFVQLGPTVTLGDSALLALALLQPQAPQRNAPVRDLLAAAGDRGAPAHGREVALCEHIDVRGLFADMWAHFKLNAQRGKD